MKLWKRLVPDNTYGGNVPQYDLKTIIFMFLWPCVWMSVLIYAVGPLLLKNGQGPLPTWLYFAIWMLGNGAELAVAIIVLHREGHRLRSWRSLKERIGLVWPKRGWKSWAVMAAVFAAAFAAAMAMSDLGTPLAKLLPPPDWMPGNPLMPGPESLQEGYADVQFAGNYGFLLYRYVILGFVMNMIGEELYYRSVLLPKMRAVFGKWDWAANGAGFALKHLYYYWRVPMLIPAGMGFALIFKIGGLPLSIISHWIGNMEPVELIQAIKAVLGM